MTILKTRLKPKHETLQKLFIRSGNECAFPDCTEVLWNDQDVPIAECCHIEAAEPGGERYNPLQTDEERRSFKNLLFLCHKHHTESNDVSKYTVEILKKIKKEHEKRFSEKPISINPSHLEQVIRRFEEIYYNINQTGNTVKKINEKQDVIIELLTSKIILKEPEADKYSEYFDIPPVYQFKGRENELLELKSNFSNYNTFLIGGLSGIGKTTFVAQFLNSIKSHKTLWIDCEIVKTKEDFLIHLAKFIKQEFSDKSVEQMLSISDDDVIQKTFVSALQKYPTCLVFDGLNSHEHALNSFLRHLNENLSSSKIFISTNHNLETNSWRNPVHKTPLKGIEKPIFMEMMGSYNIPNVTDEHGNRLYQLLNGHPYLLKISASILEYQPIEYYISQLENQGSDEISDYIKRKVVESLRSDEIDLLKQLALYEIPFRYSIGNYILPQTFSKTLKGLQEKFLVENFHSYFFNIPEFIKTYVIRESKANNDLYATFVNYLLSIKVDMVVFEKKALIHHALKANMFEVAKKEASEFLSYLMESGKFNFAYEFAHELENDPKTEKWSFIYYVQGRVLRFQQFHENALVKYKQGLKLSIDIPEQNKFNFEIASILTYLSKKLNDNTLLEKAILAYEELAQSNNASLSLQSQLSLALIQTSSGRYVDAIEKLEKLTDSINTSDIEVNVLAGMWQVLGDAYNKNEDYNKAFIAFDKSIDLYKEAQEKFGMNVIDGLYHLYNSYGWAFANAGKYSSAAEMFGNCVGLCSSFDLGNKLETALFDYGYHLTMDRQFEKAVKVLADHYSFIVDNNLISESDMPFIYGTLAFANWYSGAFIEAVELLGLYMLSCYKKNIQTVITLIEENGMADKIDVFHFYNNKMYIFIIPSGKTHNDFNDWVNSVCSCRPELVEPFSQFHYFMKDADQ